MATNTEQIEHRLSALEREVTELKSSMAPRDKLPWWRRILGEFERDAEYAEIARLGQELRRADRPE